MTSNTASELQARFKNADATIAVIGLGHVGLPVCGAMHDAGFDVIGFDIDQTKIDRLQANDGYLRHLGDAFYASLLPSDRFTPTSDPSLITTADAVLICVPTPLDDNHKPDLTYVENSTKLVAKRLRRGQLVSLESTIYPGATREVCLPILDAARPDLECGKDWFLSYSPEREDPGRTTHTTRSTPRLVGGIDAASTSVAQSLYNAAIETVIALPSAEVAEAAKLLENTYRAVNIALVNELKPILDRMGIDLWDVIDAAATKPYGFEPFYPGPGLGGHCIPIDPFYLSWKAESLGMRTRFIELAAEINADMPRRVVEATRVALEASHRKLQGANVLILGIAYKKNVDDVRETPAAEIIARLTEGGAAPSYHDPHAPEFPHSRRGWFPLESIDLTPEALEAADATIIVTDHDAIDWQAVADHAPLVIDTRNAMRSTLNPRATIIKA